MKSGYRAIYVAVSFITYVTLSLVEFFFLTHLLDIISTNFLMHLIAAFICLLVINPVITYLILGLLPIKPAKRLKGNINEDLKREV